jgi:hypothetical protein
MGRGFGAGRRHEQAGTSSSSSLSSSSTRADLMMSFLFACADSMAALVQRVLLQLPQRDGSRAQALGEVVLCRVPHRTSLIPSQRSLSVALGLSVLRAPTCPSDPLASLYTQQQKQKDTNNILDLPSLLIMPIQRIPRYKMLLEVRWTSRAAAVLAARVHVSAHSAQCCC